MLDRLINPGTVRMNKRFLILVLAALMTTAVFGARMVSRGLLSDGSILKGVDGKVIGSDANEVWCFEFSSDVNDYGVVIKSGTKLELLSSSILEKIIADINESVVVDYRLWGKITQYKGKNYIFPTYFMRINKMAGPDTDISQTSEPNQVEPSETTPEQQTDVNDSGDILTIPPEIMKRLEATQAEAAGSGRKAIDGNDVMSAESRTVQNADSVIVDRTGLLIKDEGGFVFVPDAVGRNVSPIEERLRLLPCEVLALAENRQSSVVEPIRFRIAGIITKYKNQRYLLLQKATRVYNYGNFGR